MVRLNWVAKVWGPLVLLLPLLLIGVPAQQPPAWCTANPDAPLRVFVAPMATTRCHTARNQSELVGAVVKLLAANSTYRFSWPEVASFAKWVDGQDRRKQSLVELLVSRERLEFLSGSWVQHHSALVPFDEAAHSFTLGHAYLSERFSARPTVAWQVDHGGGWSSGLPQLLGDIGLQGAVLQLMPHDQNEPAPHIEEREFVWRPHSAAEGILAHVLPAASPQQVQWASLPSNPSTAQMSQLADAFEKEVRQLAAASRTRNVLLPVPIQCHQASALPSAMAQLTKLMRHVETRSEGKLAVRYSTFDSYFKQVRHCAEVAEEWPEHEGALRLMELPRSHSKGFSGALRLRQASQQLRRALRSAELWYAQLLELDSEHKGDLTGRFELLDEARQVAARLNEGSAAGGSLTAEDALPLKGEARQQTDLMHRLSADCIGKLLGPSLTQKQRLAANKIRAVPPKLYPSSASMEVPQDVDSVMVVVVANELGWPRNESVVLPVATRSVSVTDADGFGMAAELLEDGTTAEPMLRFQALVPAMGATTFFIRSNNPNGLLRVPQVESNEHVQGDEPEALAIGRPQALQLVLSDSDAAPVRLEHQRMAMSTKFECSLAVASGLSAAPTPLFDPAQSAIISRGEVSEAVTFSIANLQAMPGLQVTWSLRVVVGAPVDSPISRMVELEYSVSGMPENMVVLLQLRTDIDNGGYVLHDQGGVGLQSSDPATPDRLLAASSTAIVRGPDTELVVLLPHSYTVRARRPGELEVVLYQRRGDEVAAEAGSTFNGKLQLLLSPTRSLDRLALSQSLLLPPTVLLGHARTRQHWLQQFQTNVDPLEWFKAKTAAEWQQVPVSNITQLLEPQIHIAAIQV